MELTRKNIFKTFTILGLGLAALEGSRFFGALLYGRVNMWISVQEASVFRWLSWLFHSPWTDILVQYVFVLGLPYLAVLLIVGRLPTCVGEKRKLPPEVFVILLVISMGAGYVFNFIGVFINLATSYMTGKSFYDMNPIMDMVSTLTPAMVIYVCLLGPLMEEVMFRGILLKRARRFGDRTAVVFCAVVFGLMHGNLSQFLYATAVGLTLGYIAVRTNRIRYNVILHMMVNSYSTILLAGETVYLNAGMNLPLIGYSLAILAVSGLLIVGAVILLILYGAQGHRQMKAANGPPSPYRKYAYLNPGFLLYCGICVFQILLYLLY